MADKEILDSWKEISDYLDRDIRTCYRWEKELRLPIHRIDENSPRSKVFAYKSEIDKWLHNKNKPNNFLTEHPNRKKNYLVALVLVFFISTLIFAFLYFTRFNSEQTISLAVFPIKNLNSTAEFEYLSSGIGTSLKNYLSTQNDLKIIEAEADDEFERTPYSIQNIGSKLGSDFLLMGTFEKFNEKCKLILQLYRTKGGRRVWIEEFDDVSENPLDFNRSICKEILKNIGIYPKDNGIFMTSGRNSEDIIAFDHYFKGSFIVNNLNQGVFDPWKIYYNGQFYSNHNMRESNEIAIELFLKAIEMRPDFAPAFIGLADCYINFLNFGWRYEVQWLYNAEELLFKAKSFSHDFPEFYSTLCKVYLAMSAAFNIDTLDKAFTVAQEGLEKYPNSPHINAKMSYCNYLRYGESGSEEFLKKALYFMENSYLMRPNYIGNIFYADLLSLAGKHNEALDVALRLKQNNSIEVVNYCIASIYYLTGELEKCKQLCISDHPTITTTITNLYLLGKIAALENDVVQAKTYAEQIVSITPDLQRFSTSYLELSSIYFGIDEKDKAYSNFEIFFSFPEVENMKYIYKNSINFDPNFDQVRHESKFQKILEGENDGKE